MQRRRREMDIKKDKKPGANDTAKKPLRKAITEIDQEILRLLLRRNNLLEKMKRDGRLDIAEERYLREAWQNDVARVSRDAELASRFFALMQQVKFLPKPGGSPEGVVPGCQRRESFNLAPPQAPVNAALAAPLDQWATCAWLYTAACAGAPLRIGPCLQNDAIIDCIKALVQMGAALSREEENIIARSAAPLGTPDKVLHAGSDVFILYLIIAHYAARPSRVKITGSTSLQLVDLSFLRSLLPELGARLVNVVPKSNGLPARIEASGILSAGLALGDEVPASFAEALLLAAPHYNTSFAVDLAGYSQRESVVSRVMPVLENSGAVFVLQGATISFSPCIPSVPKSPAIAMDAGLASFLLGFAAVLGGEVALQGSWPALPQAAVANAIFSQLGWKSTASSVILSRPSALEDFEAPAIGSVGWQTALAVALAACACLAGGNASLSPDMQADETAHDLLRIAGISLADDGTLALAGAYAGLGWTAPSAAWAMALALIACRRRDKTGFSLTNPGIVTDFWPRFWSFYNSLPNPKLKKSVPEQPPLPAKNRRRLITDAVAVPPRIREEDWQ